MKQIEIPILSAHQPPRMLPQELIDRCKSEYDAFHTCWDNRTVKYEQGTAADLLGIQHSHFSNILSGKKHPPWGFGTNLQILCGNWAIRQYRDRVEGFRMAEESPLERELRLTREKLAKLERRVA